MLTTLRRHMARTAGVVAVLGIAVGAVYLLWSQLSVLAGAVVASMTALVAALKGVPAILKKSRSVADRARDEAGRRTAALDQAIRTDEAALRQLVAPPSVTSSPGSARSCLPRGPRSGW
jgi:hypothetical protein